MIMMLPFVTILLSAWYTWRGHRRVGASWWWVTLAIYICWCFYHMTSPLNLSL
ncbi:DUF5993 family protein [Microbulbifer magnicolonia]|uniref:DUF5993 family protein n=1 Tax=Microbulbifer magnicolonia TaxID=3109744 RepID=UPI002B40FDF0|nr:DUF5993 family protein [Microbulbifer sp. GG15]